ncbi:MAG: hypothetical protein QW667_08270 [Candidatus Bathyarchaeia archaeon]
MSYESLDSVINVLKWYEEYLGNLITKLRKITGELGKAEDAHEWQKKIKSVENRLFSIEAKVSDFLRQIYDEKLAYALLRPPIVRCWSWDEFKNSSCNAELVSFLVEERERCFQVTALKDGKIFVYGGDFPSYGELLKTWISRELSAEDKKVVEGVLSLG